MKYKEWEDSDGLNSYCQLSIPILDFIEVRLDSWDRKLLEECNKSNKISDKLLALETIARRLEQAHPQENLKEGE